MAWKRKDSRFYWIGPLRAGAVDVPRLSTGQGNKATARAMEDALKVRAVTGFADMVRQVADRTLGLAEFYAAHIEGTEALETLRERGSDPDLDAVVAEYRPNVSDTRVLDGLGQLLALAPKGARLSTLRDPTALSNIYSAAVAGKDRDGRRRAPNSVRRSLHRAVAEILTHRLGRGQMLAVMADVKVPAANDERVVMMTRAEIQAALDAADPEFRPVLGLAITTGIDRAALLRIRGADYHLEEGTLRVTDTKTASRPRTLLLRGEPILENAEHWLGELQRWADDPQEQLVPLKPKQIRTRWEAIREDIGRPDVRWKDLRGIFATYYLQAGGDPRTLQHVLGHSAMSMTLRYLRRTVVGSQKHVSASARQMGLPAPRLRLERGDAS